MARLVALGVTAAVVVGAAVGGCLPKKKKEQATTTTVTQASADAPSVKAAGGATQTTCPPVDPAKVAAFEVDRSAIKGPIPDIEDAKESLSPFYDQVLALARGTQKSHVRIGVYGDSNLTSDHLTGHLRRQLQARFGDVGHGWVGLARPWTWYAHEDVRHSGTWPLFKQMACTTDPSPGHRYGFANMAAESSMGGASAWVGTADASAPIGRSVSRFDVYFMKQPKGGAFDLMLDGKLLRTVSTAANDYEAGFELVETTDASHDLKCLIKGDGKVRLFGATLERDLPSSGLFVDSLGVGAMNFERFMLTEPAIRKAQLEHRKYDLVIIWLGMNSMWLPPNRAWVHDTITTLREALPSLPVLVLTPPDSVKPGEGKTDPRIVQLVKQLREVAEETGAAFWDFRAAMGGEASYLEFMKRGLAANDRAHLSQQGNALMGQRLLSAMFTNVTKRLETNPSAGCPRAK